MRRFPGVAAFSALLRRVRGLSSHSLLQERLCS